MKFCFTLMARFASRQDLSHWNLAVAEDKHKYNSCLGSSPQRENGLRQEQTLPILTHGLKWVQQLTPERSTYLH